MPDLRTSRELAERVEIEFHHRPNMLRRRMWRLSAVAVILSLAWLAYAAVKGQYDIYVAGALATPHQMFENDCAKCHTNWGPAERLWDAVSKPLPAEHPFFYDKETSSVSNEKCIACHPGPAHRVDQVPEHNEISCAQCHRDHMGKDHDLAWLANQQCIACHDNLKVVKMEKDEDGSLIRTDEIIETESFHRTIDNFDLDGHPEFGVLRLMAQEGTLPKKNHSAKALVAEITRTAAEEPDEKWKGKSRWQDVARIRFNHAKHLDPKLLGEDGKELGKSMDCQECHKPDAARRYMLPIVYETHCEKCHALPFDVENFPGKRVPHETPELVRGFLTDVYTLRTLREAAKPVATADDENSNAEATSVLGLPSRDIPGRKPFGTRLSAEEIEEIKKLVDEAELLVKDHESWLEVNKMDRLSQQRVHSLFGVGGGGCKYCHVVNETNDGSVKDWEVVKPNIPDRWYPHSRFRHDSHRMLRCTVCHEGVADSKSTGDVLMPSIKSCLGCHTNRIKPNSPNSNAKLVAARTDCVECHSYHNHKGENFNGRLNTLLEPQAAKDDETSSPENSK